MSGVILPGLGTGFGDTPVARRAGLLATDDDTLVDAMVALCLVARTIDVEPLAATVGLPVGEVIASPFGLRAVAMAAEVGAATVQSELRAPLPWPPELDGDDAIAVDPHGYWERGVLHAGKYRSFLQDEAFATFNPNHMSKWGPHELTHRACGFFWREDASRWELYVGARLNELVPVVLWYGPDECARLDRIGFDRAREAVDREAPPARALWWREPETSLRRRISESLVALRDGVRHFERELAAIDSELSTGAITPCPHNGLDASSDAIAYVVGHFERLSSERFSAFASSVLRPGVDYETSPAAYRDRVERAFDTLLFGDIEVDFERARRRVGARLAWDLAHRAAHHEAATLRRLAPVFSTAAATIAAAWDGGEKSLSDPTSALTDAVSQAFRSSARAAVFATGLAVEPGPRVQGWANLDGLDEGLRSLAPVTAQRLNERQQQGAAADWRAELVDSGALLARRDLAARFRLGLADRLEEDSVAHGLWQLETAIAATGAGDDRIERLCVPVDEVPDAIAHGRIVASRSFRLVEFAPDAVDAHFIASRDGEIPDAELPERGQYLVGVFCGEVAIVPAPSPVVELWRALDHGPVSAATAAELLAAATEPSSPDRDTDGERPSTPEGWLHELIGAGAIGWDNTEVR